MPGTRGTITYSLTFRLGLIWLAVAVARKSPGARPQWSVARRRHISHLRRTERLMDRIKATRISGRGVVSPTHITPMARTSYAAHQARATTLRHREATRPTDQPGAMTAGNGATATLNTTPTYHQPVFIQFRADIWITGRVTNHFYNVVMGMLVTEVEFYAADGTRSRSGFLDRDIRPRSE
ncbi:hypothetical protein C2E23DRAFT_838114 [Lenzites betulinus]|nr:hypothetical protein C2E23DRAFT_838114 [Lenzites betulinus]